MTHPFDRLVRQDERRIRLAEASLLFAADHCPGLEPARFLAKLDGLAARVRARGAGTTEARAAALRDVLVGEEGLRGNLESYDDPRNSFLNEVLDRKAGIPVSLSVVWLDVAAQLGWPLVGLGLPGHFIVRLDDPAGPLLLDPFDQGRALEPEDLKRLLPRMDGGRVALAAAHMQPMRVKATLARQLHNLRAIFAAGERWHAADLVLARLLAMEPDDDELKAERTNVRGRLARLN